MQLLLVTSADFDFPPAIGNPSVELRYPCENKWPIPEPTNFKWSFSFSLPRKQKTASGHNVERCLYMCNVAVITLILLFTCIGVCTVVHLFFSIPSDRCRHRRRPGTKDWAKPSEWISCAISFALLPPGVCVCEFGEHLCFATILLAAHRHRLLLYTHLGRSNIANGARKRKAPKLGRKITSA